MKDNVKHSFKVYMKVLKVAFLSQFIQNEILYESYSYWCLVLERYNIIESPPLVGHNDDYNIHVQVWGLPPFVNFEVLYIVGIIDISNIFGREGLNCFEIYCVHLQMVLYNMNLPEILFAFFVIQINMLKYNICAHMANYEGKSLRDDANCAINSFGHPKIIDFLISGVQNELKSTEFQFASKIIPDHLNHVSLSNSADRTATQSSISLVKKEINMKEEVLLKTKHKHEFLTNTSLNSKIITMNWLMVGVLKGNMEGHRGTTFLAGTTHPFNINFNIITAPKGHRDVRPLDGLTKLILLNYMKVEVFTEALLNHMKSQRPTATYRKDIVWNPLT